MCHSCSFLPKHFCFSIEIIIVCQNCHGLTDYIASSFIVLLVACIPGVSGIYSCGLSLLFPQQGQSSVILVRWLVAAMYHFLFDRGNQRFLKHPLNPVRGSCNQWANLPITNGKINCWPCRNSLTYRIGGALTHSCWLIPIGNHINRRWVGKWDGECPAEVGARVRQNLISFNCLWGVSKGRMCDSNQWVKQSLLRA